MSTRTATTRSQTAKAAKAAPSAPIPVKIEKKRLSVLQLLDMIPGLAAIVATGIVSFITGFFRSQRDSKTYYLHVANTILRKATFRLSPLQLQ